MARTLTVPRVRVRFQTLEMSGLDLHVRSLRDGNQSPDSGGADPNAFVSSASWPLSGMLWDSGIVLAELMLDQPVEGLRILEVGCGLALGSIVLSLQGANITASDHNPAARGFLSANVALNGAQPIPFVRVDWADLASDLGQFDLIIGSDLLYERDHAALLSAFVDRHAKPHSEVLIVDPGRKNMGHFVRRMEGCDWRASRRRARDSGLLDGRSAGHVMTFVR